MTIPKRLRVHTRFDRQLLGKLSSSAWTYLKAEAGRLLGRHDVVPGMIAAIQTHGELLHWHPHLHGLITCGAFTPEGDFLALPEFDLERLLVAWQDAVFELCLAEKKIISFIERRQQDVIERILRRCGLWEGPLCTLAHPRAPPAPAAPDV